MMLSTPNGSTFTEQNLYQRLFTLGFAAFPLFALTTFKGHRAIAILLLLLAIAALARKYREWNPSLKCWAWAMAALTVPLYIGYFFGEVQGPTMERASYGWLFLAIGSAACVFKPNHAVFVGALILGAFATLVAQFIDGSERPSLAFNPIPYANVAAVFFCLLCVCIGKMKKPWMTVAVIAGLIGWLGVIALTQTRGAILALAPGLVYVLIYLGKRYGKKISILVVVALLAAGWVGDSLTGNLVSSRFQLALDEIKQYQEQPKKFSSVAVRLELWRSALMVVQENPMGMGEEGSRAQALKWSKEGKIQKYVQPQLKIAHFHSDYLQQLAVAGYLGLLGLLLFYGLLIGHFYRHRHQVGATMGLVVVFSYMISGLTDVPMYNRLTVFAFFVIITFCLASISHRQTVTPNSNSHSFRSPAH